MQPSLKPDTPLAAILVDFENIYYSLRDAMTERKDYADDILVDLLPRLRAHLEEAYGERSIALDAYADFDRIEDNVQSALYLIGFETHNVLGTDHKNAADMKLCVDATAMMYERPEIGTFVIVAGDRDYIPVIRHLKKHGRIVRVGGFRQNTSGDLLTNLGAEYFIDLAQFMGPLPQTSRATASDAQEHRMIALRAALRYYPGKPEIWLVPFLHKLRAELPQLDEWQRKAILKDLRDCGAITVEKRKGEPNDYSVILLNREHEEVRQASAA